MTLANPSGIPLNTYKHKLGDNKKNIHKVLQLADNAFKPLFVPLLCLIQLIEALNLLQDLWNFLQPHIGTLQRLHTPEYRALNNHIFRAKYMYIVYNILHIFKIT